ncbi:hypothetical protein [Paenibacillus sp. N3.4]|uniref:hypothetical protein n=1 Tax=Paenibacillus sp. N3.4 TaxID=2603222 RepID=UPI00164F8EE2|nr:hypothetical protein [Paenibacillus sp. N3.4]
MGGDTLVRGGGLHPFYIVGSTHGEVEVNKSSGDVRVALDDQSEIDHIVTYCILQHDLHRQPQQKRRQQYHHKSLRSQY